MQSIAIIFMAVAAAIVYGIFHDQVTARICVEYFTIGHPRLIASTSPTVLGLFWGVVATWWVGLPLGIGLAVASRAGSRPKLKARDLIRPILKLLGAMYVVAILAGLIGFLTANGGVFHLVGPLAARIPADRHVAFLTDGWAHSASYLAGVVGGIVLCTAAWRRRGSPAILIHDEPGSPGTGQAARGGAV